MIVQFIVPYLLHWRFGDPDAPPWFRRTMCQAIRAECTQRWPFPGVSTRRAGMFLVAFVFCVGMFADVFGHARASQILTDIVFMLCLSGSAWLVHSLLKDLQHGLAWMLAHKGKYQEILQREMQGLTGHQRLEYARHVQARRHAGVDVA